MYFFSSKFHHVKITFKLSVTKTTKLHSSSSSNFHHARPPNWSTLFSFLIYALHHLTPMISTVSLLYERLSMPMTQRSSFHNPCLFRHQIHLLSSWKTRTHLDSSTITPVRIRQIKRKSASLNWILTFFLILLIAPTWRQQIFIYFGPCRENFQWYRGKKLPQLLFCVKTFGFL